MNKNSSPSRPGEAALQNMQILKCESSVFKVPKVPKKKDVKKAQVLDEEDYVEVRHSCKLPGQIIYQLNLMFSCCC